jgi:hypothetical protein
LGHVGDRGPFLRGGEEADVIVLVEGEVEQLRGADHLEALRARFRLRFLLGGEGAVEAPSPWCSPPVVHFIGLLSFRLRKSSAAECGVACGTDGGLFPVDGRAAREAVASAALGCKNNSLAGGQRPAERGLKREVRGPAL